MSIHSSFKSGDTMKRHRSVLSRLERIRILQEKGVIDLESGSVLGMPKVKNQKIRVKKEKAATPAAGAAAPGAEGTAAPAAAGGAAGAKPAAGAKSSAKPAAGAAKPEAGAPAKKKE